MLHDDKNWLFNEYIGHKKTIENIAKDCGVCPATIYKRLVEFDISRRPKVVKRIYLDYESLYEEYIVKGRSPYEICKDFNCSVGTIYRELKRLEILIRSRSESKREERNPLFGLQLSEEHRPKIAQSNIGREVSEETRLKISQANSGENNGMFGIPSEEHPMWRGGSSFEPYCPKFNNELKEKIRNRDHRVCQACGTSELFLGERLCVHHVDLNKMQGCDGHKWYLISLCRNCHTKLHNLSNFMVFI